jgi:hypothetical protein
MRRYSLRVQAQHSRQHSLEILNPSRRRLSPIEEALSPATEEEARQREVCTSTTKEMMMMPVKDLPAEEAHGVLEIGHNLNLRDRSDALSSYRMMTTGITGSIQQLG